MKRYESEITLSRLAQYGHLVLRPKEQNKIDILLEEILDIRMELRVNNLVLKEIVLTPKQYDMLLRNFRYKLMDNQFKYGVQDRIYGLDIIIGKHLKEETI